MDILLWIIGIALVVIGLVGTVLPALPGAMLIVAGLVVAAWADGFTKVGVWTLVVIGVSSAAGRRNPNTPICVSSTMIVGQRDSNGSVRSRQNS